MDNERRKEARKNVSLEAHWEGLSGKHHARLSDISPGGCFVDTRGQVAIGDAVTIEIVLPSGQKLELRGEVTHHQYDVGFSLRFDDLTDEDRHLIGQLIA